MTGLIGKYKHQYMQFNSESARIKKVEGLGENGEKVDAQKYFMHLMEIQPLDKHRIPK